MVDAYSSIPLLDAEVWRAVVDTDARYEVSNLGRVRTVRTRYGNPQVKLHHPWLNHGYPTVAIRRIYWTRSKPVAVHLLIAEAFLGPCPPGHEVNHIDFTRANSVLSNLEYVTYSENNLHAFRHGRQPVRGERVGSAKFTTDDIRTIRSLSGTHVEIAKQYGVHPATILRIRKREQWQHLT